MGARVGWGRRARRLSLTAAVLAGGVAGATPTSPALATSTLPGAGSIVYIRDHNIWLTDAIGSRKIQVTHDGTTASSWGYPSQANDGTIAAAKNVRTSATDVQAYLYVMDRQGNLRAGSPIHPPQ